MTDGSEKRADGPAGPAAGGGVIETDSPPRFLPNEKVRSLVAVRNDGTAAGFAMGARLVEAGDEGYVVHVGEFLQRYYIYAVDFLGAKRIVGMRAHELQSLDSVETDRSV